jgi:hypothetical protein
MCRSGFEPLSARLGPWAVDGSFVSYKGLLKMPLRSYGCLGRDWHRNRGFCSALVRGVSHPCEGSKILSFLFRPRLVCNSLLPKLVERESCEHPLNGVLRSSI